jgi:histidinol-phosphatase (PHP family)
MITADPHTHTCYSHGAGSVADMHGAARRLGLRIHGFSEHSPRPCGYGYAADYQEKLQARFADYLREVRDLRRENTEEFRTLLGLELDFIAGELAFGREAAQAADFDYIIGGLHFQGVWGFDADAEDWEKLSSPRRQACYARYYEDLAGLCASGLADIVAHPDLIKIFTLESFRDWLKLPTSRALVRGALAEAGKRDLLLEISSAGLRKPCREIYPGPALMETAADLGLKICLSSDAHSAGDIAYAFAELEAYARSFGFSEYYYLEGRRKKALQFQG